MKNLLSIDFIKGLTYLSMGIILGVLSAFSFLRTNWESFKPDFFFWISIFSTVASIVLLFFSIWQYLVGKSEKEKNSAQIKIWMEGANGLHQSLRTIGISAISQSGMTSKYSSVNDVGLAIYGVADNAKALYQSLYEERCVTEAEYTKQQTEIGDAMHQQRLAQFKRTQNPIQP
jgi:signal transduction histidine kinase